MLHQQSRQFMEKRFRFFHPLENRGGCNQVKLCLLYTSRLEGQVDAVLSLSNDIWGYCYTQLTDVEQEQNGIYYYDRTPKFDMKRIHAIFSKTPDSK